MNKVALITGGSRGIGLGIAKSLAAEGFNLVINGVRDKNKVKPTLSDLSDLGVDVVYCQGDIAQTSVHKNIVNTVNDRFKRLDLLVNNAGVAPKERRDLLEATEESFEFVIKTNLQGPYFLTQSVAKWMIEQKQNYDDYHPCIINISSISASIASVNRGEYCLAKAGMTMMTKLFASRLGEYDIPVYEVQPGVIKTDMTAGVEAKYDKLIGEGLTVQKRWGRPEDVGKAVLALAKGLFPYSSGQIFMVDGGLTIPRL
jgi:NAD(P)-dependent dehydrogenase (short-subunit alcohol dehydrogenase family)